AGGVGDPGKAKPEAAAAPTPPRQPDLEVVEESELVLGSLTDRSPAGYRLGGPLPQKGARLETLYSPRHHPEFEHGLARKRPLRLIGGRRIGPASLTMTINAGDGAPPAAARDEAAAGLVPGSAADAEDWMDSVLWGVVRDPEHVIKTPITMIDPATRSQVEGKSIAFRTKAPSGVIVTKTYRLGKGIDGLELELKFASPDREQKVVYNLLGPYGIPIEGEWYTQTFRDLFF